MTLVERELVVSVALLGAVIGSLVAGPMSDNLGRKPSIIMSDILFATGSVLMGFAQSIALLMIGRVLVGLGVGVASMVVPIYLSEVAPVSIRGAVVAFFVVAVTLGQLISSGIALACGRNWRLMLGLAAVPAIIQGTWQIFMPESQRWLAT